jgi:hypothetical protein
MIMSDVNNEGKTDITMEYVHIFRTTSILSQTSSVPASSGKLFHEAIVLTIFDKRQN